MNYALFPDPRLLLNTSSTLIQLCACSQLVGITEKLRQTLLGQCVVMCYSSTWNSKADEPESVTEATLSTKAAVFFLDLQFSTLCRNVCSKAPIILDLLHTKYAAKDKSKRDNRLHFCLKFCLIMDWERSRISQQSISKTALYKFRWSRILHIHVD